MAVEAELFPAYCDLTVGHILSSCIAAEATVSGR